MAIKVCNDFGDSLEISTDADTQFPVIDELILSRQHSPSSSNGVVTTAPLQGVVDELDLSEASLLSQMNSEPVSLDSATAGMTPDEKALIHKVEVDGVEEPEQRRYKQVLVSLNGHLYDPEASKEMAINFAKVHGSTEVFAPYNDKRSLVSFLSSGLGLMVPEWLDEMTVVVEPTAKLVKNLLDQDYMLVLAGHSNGAMTLASVLHRVKELYQEQYGQEKGNEKFAQLAKSQITVETIGADVTTWPAEVRNVVGFLNEHDVAGLAMRAIGGLRELLRGLPTSLGEARDLVVTPGTEHGSRHYIERYEEFYVELFRLSRGGYREHGLARTLAAAELHGRWSDEERAAILEFAVSQIGERFRALVEYYKDEPLRRDPENLGVFTYR